MTEPEVLAVQQLAPLPSDESVTRTWYRITQMSAAPSARRRRWMPIAAAASVLLLAAASLTLVRIGPGTLWPVASTPDAVASLAALADTALNGAPAPTLQPGQLVYVEIEGWAAAFGSANGDLDNGVLHPQPRRMWFNPQGMVVVKITDGTSDLGSGAKAESQPRVEQPATGLLSPTPEWLAGLPTDPAQLLSLLRKEVGQNDRWTVDHQLWDALGQLYSEADVLLSPQVRAALLRASAGMTGLSARTVSVNGVQLVAIRHTDGDSGAEILFDPGTGRAVGRASVFLATDVTIVAPPGTPALDPGVGYQATWTQSIVDSVPTP